IETLPVVRSKKDRDRLLAVIHHDIRRLDRLISDISDASRLDAELAREDAGPVDMARLLEAVVGMSRDMAEKSGISIALTIDDSKGAKATLRVDGHDSRLAQVVTNLIDNAVS